MNQGKLKLYMHVLLAFCFVSVSFIDYFYRLLFNSAYSPFLSFLLILFALTVILTVVHIVLFKPYKNMLIEINKSYKDIMSELTITEEEKNCLITDQNFGNFQQLIELYKTSQKQQCELVCELTNTNKILDQNNKFANAIMQITSEILSSKDIHSVLQLILEKSIEIIPNAQKGSILLYNKDFLEYKAMYGYDLEALKDFKFTFDEIFQGSAKDIYEPIIIHDVEQYNANLKKDKFDVLKETRSFDLKSSISCAISIDNQFYGTINIDNIESNYAFSDEHKPMIKYFAEQIGIALKNAQLIEKILYLSQYDSLTGISNRAHFEEQLNQLHTSCEQNNQSYSLIIIDMNDLKVINDTYGHEAGDKLIITFTQYIGNMTHKPDIFGRIGGDEFALAYSSKTELELTSIMQHIQDHFSAVPFIYNDNEVLTITFGFGISTYPSETDDISTLFKMADQRMYVNKRNIKEMKQVL